MPSSPSLSERLIRSGYKEFQDRDAELTNKTAHLRWAFLLVILAEWDPRSGYGRQTRAQEFIPSTGAVVRYPAGVTNKTAHLRWAFLLAILIGFNHWFASNSCYSV